MFILNKNEFTQKVLDAESTLYHVAKSILRSEADCEDAVQEAIAIAWQKLPTLKTDAYFTTWLVRILINECKSVLRRPKAAGDIACSKLKQRCKRKISRFTRRLCGLSRSCALSQYFITSRGTASKR